MSTIYSLRVTAIRQEAPDIRSFELTPVDGGALPPMEPGAHIDIHTGEGLVRQYSLCNGPEERGDYRIAVKREPGSRGGSSWMHDQLRVGDLLTVAGPRNNFVLRPGTGPHLLLAGGIGMTPVFAMARHLAADGHPLAFHYFARDQASAAFRDDISRLLAAHATLHLGLDPAGTRAELARIIGEAAAQSGAQVYFCGPAPFLDLVLELTRDWPAGTVHYERFSAAPVDPSGERGFHVELARSGGRYHVPPGQSIVAALAEHGIEIMTSCEQGVCGTCLTPLLAGDPDHRDMVLSDAEAEAKSLILPCVSRARSDLLVLDL